jgi:type VI secretion system protein ImpH
MSRDIDLFEKLFTQGYLFDFFQAVRLLELWAADEQHSGGAGGLFDRSIRFKPHSGLAFPASDLHGVTLLGEHPARAEVIATFMGLYGIDSPLPVYFYDQIGTEGERTRPLGDFLDIFNHRIYSLFYQSWKRSRPTVHHKSAGDDPWSQKMLCLAGIGTPAAARQTVISPMHLAAFAGRLSGHVRNVDGLKSLLSTVLGGISVSVIENVPRWWPIPERPRIGGIKAPSMALGQNATIGQKVRDISGKFRIVLGPLSLAQYCGFVPKGKDVPLLSLLVKLYAPDHLGYDVELRLRSEEIPKLCLGERPNELGRTTWLGRPSVPVTSRVQAYEASA